MSKKVFLIMLISLITVGTLFSAQVEIRAAWWGDTGRHALYNEIVDIFEVKNPDIKVIREPTSWLDYWDKLTVQTAGKRAPDFMGMHLQFAADYVRRGVLEPLDKYIEEGIIDVSKFSQTALDSGTVDGTIYMIPKGLTAQSIFVNISALQELGIEPPDFDWTWNDVERIGLEVRKELDTRGEKNKWFMNDHSGAYVVFRYWVRQRGTQDLYTMDGDIAYTAEDVATWFSMWNNFRIKGIIPDPPTVTEYAQSTLEDSLFARQRIFATNVPANQFKLYVNALKGKELELVRNPSLEGGLPGEFMEGSHWAISAYSSPEKKEAAAKLINFWLNDPDSIELFRLDEGVPANREMAEYLLTLLDEVDQKIVEFVNRVSEIASIPITFMPAGATEVNSLFEQIAERVRFGVLTPEEAGEQMVNEAQKILDRYK